MPCAPADCPILARSVRKGGIPHCSSAVGLAAVADGSDLDCILVFKVEENPVIATAEPEAGERRLELL